MSLSSDLQRTLVSLIRSQHVAALGTIRMGAPEVSMVLYLPANDLSAFFMHISGLAHHTQNIKREPRVSLMIMESSSDSKRTQQLPRVSVQGRANPFSPESEGYTEIRQAYINRFPESEMMFTLGDFGLYRIDPVSGRFVAGFAQAHNLTAADFIEAAHAFPEQ